MSIVRAQMILQPTTGKPKDRAVNTFHFNMDASDDAALANVRDKLGRFYYQANTNTFSVGEWLSNMFTGVVCKMYDVTTEPAGVPILVSGEWALPTRQNASDLPNEVALCLSFEGTPSGTLVQARRRGRVYIGPLNMQCVITGTAPARPNTSFLQTLRQAGQRLATEVDPDAEWVVYSRPYAGRGEIVRPGKATLPALPARPGATVNIDRVWTDDAFDTQRRRGVDATVKTYAATD